MTPTSQRPTQAILRSTARVLSALMILLSIPFAVAVFSPGTFGPETKYWMKLTLVTVALLYFSVQGLSSGRDKSASRASVYFGLFMLLELIDLLLRRR